jgi:UDP-GlcNAc:undecaprenyl-phosphate GlcNAc-1-phosphate transferase
MIITEKYLLFIYSFCFVIFYFIYRNKDFISNKINIIDYPDTKRKRHITKTSLIGGLLIFSCLIYIVCIDQIFQITQNYIFKVTIILIPIFLIGLLDDIHNLSPKTKTISLLFFLIIFFFLNDEFLLKEIYFDDFKKIYLLNNKFVSLSITTLCVLLLINAFNMCDGINGLAHSIVSLWLVTLILMFNLNITFYFIVSIILISLLFNIKGKYFLGNSGSLLLGTFISLMTIYLYNHHLHLEERISVENIVLIFLIPGLDMMRLFIIRIANDKNPFVGDRHHFHHYLIKNINLSKTILLYLILMVWPLILIKTYKIKFFFIMILQMIIFSFLVSNFYQKKLKTKKN